MNKIGTCRDCDKAGVTVYFGPKGFDGEPVFLCQEHKIEHEKKTREVEDD